MYSKPPDVELSLDDFEAFAIERLRVLRTIEQLRTRENTDRKQEDSLIRDCLEKFMPWRHDDFEAGERKDLVGHFILRLAHCSTEDQRRWFLTHECHLFKHRLQQLSGDEISKFTKANGLDFEAVGSDEKQRVSYELQTVASLSSQAGPGGVMNGGMAGAMAGDFYKIPFTQALDLVGKRQVYLEGGFAFVPGTNLVSIIVSRFRAALSKSLLQAKAAFPIVSQDPRLAPLLNGVHRQYVGNTDFASKALALGEVTPESMDEVAKRSMPLCMSKLHGVLKRDHKLKHQGRQQFWLFLKGAGLSLEDSVRFFTGEFSKIMSVESFNKEHLYNIRHCYGKEGKRTDYSPYSCMKIIMGSPPGSGEAHGCPYRHSNEATLTAMLQGVNITGANKDDVLQHVRKSNFQVACQRHFELAHQSAYAKGISTDGVGNHPNAWTQASLDYHRTTAAADGGSGANGGANLFSAKSTAVKSDATGAAAAAEGDGSGGGGSVVFNGAPPPAMAVGE